MTRTELTVSLGKMFCNYIQESDDLETFTAIALGYIEENSELDFEDDAQFDTALQILDDVYEGRY